MYPATLFVPLNPIARKGIIPGQFEGLLHHRLVEKIRSGWCLHWPLRLTVIPETN
jgi:hypothetical protein